jgi:hypothetical protein
MDSGFVVREAALAKFDNEYERWKAALDAIGMDRMDEPAMMGEWPAKQLVAHIAGWQWKMLASMRTALAGADYPPTPWPAEFNDESDWETDGDVEAINQWIHDTAERATAEQIVDASLRQWDEIRAIIAGLDEKDLNDPDLFPRLEGQSLAARLSGEGLFGHVAEHLEDDVNPWLERHGRRD